jgi:hypothetical protein
MELNLESAFEVVLKYTPYRQKAGITETQKKINFKQFFKNCQELEVFMSEALVKAGFNVNLNNNLWKINVPKYIAKWWDIGDEVTRRIRIGMEIYKILDEDE